MASISQLKLPDNTIYNIKGSIHNVIGTQTASTNSWTGNLTSIDALYDGLTIAYYLPYAGSGKVSLNLTLKNNVTTGAINCYLNNDTQITTQYKNGSIVCLTYFSAGSISIDGTPTTSARWVAQMGYEMVILSYGSSTWNDFIVAYNTNSLVYCRASSNSNPASGNQTRMAFMAYVNSNPPTEVEFQYYRSVSSHSATQQGDQVYIYKLNKNTGWSVTVREAKIKMAAGQGLTSNFASNTLTFSLASAYGDTQNPYGTKTANYVLAGPSSGTAAAPAFRQLVAADIPDLSGTYLTSFTETDPIFTASAAHGISSSDISNWNSKADGTHTHDSYVNQNAFSNVIVGSTTIAADTTTDTLTLTAGSNITLTPDATNDKVTIAATDTTYSSLTAANGGTDVSLVTTGEKYTWNSKTSNNGTVTSITLKAGDGISLDTDNTAITSSGTRTISHADTSSQSSSSNSGRTYIQSVTLDDYGHVTGLSTATESVTNTDTKLQVAAITSGTTYYPIVGTGTSAATRQYDTTGLVYVGTNGTANGTNGNSLLTLGNSTASTTANWKKGTVRLYGTTAYYTDIVSGAPTVNRTVTLPNATGTIALTSDIPTVPTNISSFTNDAGYSTLTLGSTSSTAAAGNHTHSFTPAGTIAVNTAGTTTTVNSITAVGTLPTLTTEDFTIPNVTSVGTTPTLGTAIAADDITAWTTNTPTTITYTARSIPNVTAAGTATYASGTLTITNTTLGTAIAADDITAYSVGTAASLSYTARSIPNVTSVGTTPTLGTAFSVTGVDTFSQGTLPTKGSNTTVKTGDASYKFTGTAGTTGNPA